MLKAGPDEQRYVSGWQSRYELGTSVSLRVSIRVSMPTTIAITVGVVYDVSMEPVTDELLIATARKYGLAPDGLKCQAFALFDQGYSRSEVRFLLRSLRSPQRPRSFSNTIRKYHFLWQKAQGTQQPGWSS